MAAPERHRRVVPELVDDVAGVATGLRAHAAGVAPVEREVLPHEHALTVGFVVQLRTRHVPGDAHVCEGESVDVLAREEINTRRRADARASGQPEPEQLDVLDALDAWQPRTREQLSTVPPIDWTIEGLVQRGVAGLLVATGSTGKTTLMMQAGLCVSTGTPPPLLRTPKPLA